MKNKRQELIIEYLKNPNKLAKALSNYNSFSDTLEIPRSDKIRQILIDLDSAYLSYCYAYYVDKKPHDETRKLCCKSPSYAFWYAKYIDKSFHKDTWNAVKEIPLVKEAYMKWQKSLRNRKRIL